MNLVLITSVINISSNPLSFTTTRSFCGKEKRFEDTKKTIESVKKYIKNCEVFLIELSELPREYDDYLKANTDYYLNLCDDKDVVHRCNSLSKSMGEGTMTIRALEYVRDKGIHYKNLFKLSGRYWLNDTFDFSRYDNDSIVVKKLENIHNIFTCMYKLPKRVVSDFHSFLIASENDFKNYIGYEAIFAKFVNSLSEKRVCTHDKIGINGHVSVCGTFVDV